MDGVAMGERTFEPRVLVADIDEMDTSACGWFLLMVQGGREVAVYDDLRSEGVRAYVPMARRVKRIRGQRGNRGKVVSAPVFPGYMFCSATASWRLLLETRGVRQIVCQNGAPARISDEQVGDLMLLQDCGMFDETQLPPTTRIRVGDEVLVLTGVSDGYMVTVKGVSRGGKVLRYEQRGKLQSVPVDKIRIVA